MTASLFTKYPRTLWVVMLLGPICPFGIAQETEPAPFVDFPEPTVAYLQRIQAGEQSHAFEASLDFATWQRDARQALEDLVGLTRLQRDLAQFEPTVTLGEPIIVDDAFSRTQGAIETEPGIKIPFYLLVPVDAEREKTYPLMLCPHGHDTKGWHSYAGAYLNDDHRKEIVSRAGNIAEQAARRGFIAIAPATRGLAAEVNVPDPKGRHGKRPCRAQLMHCLVAGRTPLGERLWDMQRLLDWACKLPQVDPHRILMTGNSGGGVLTAYTAAIDTRISVAIPSCSFTSLTTQEGFLFHCDCCLVPGLRDWGDWKEIGGLIAPRHLLIVHGRKDRLHHHTTVERTAQSVAKIYNQVGSPNRMRLQWGEEGHRFYPQYMWPFTKAAFFLGDDGQ